MNNKILFVYLCVSISSGFCDLQVGPDPWHLDSSKEPATKDDLALPPDLRVPLKKQSDTKFTFGEWWFKRLLAIMLKSGQLKKSEDGSLDVSLKMRFDEDKWQVLEECMKSESTLSDVMFRRTVGYVEEAIYKPTITDQIVIAWTDYIQVYLAEYKMHITLTCGILGAVGLSLWLGKHVSIKHIVLLLFVLLYIYEVIISYKEAEQQEYDKFISAMNTCKWYFWTSECAVPTPDPILFMKYMNPMKIAIRMFTSIISEPVVAINSTIKVILLEITDGLWFPFDKIVYGLLIVIINISLIFLLIMVVFNFIFNIPFNLSFLGLVNIGVRQNRRTVIPTASHTQPQVGDVDRISGERLDRILNVCSIALNNVQNRPQNFTQIPANNNNYPKLQRSSSTGRLPKLCSLDNNNDNLLLNDNLRKRHRGEGDSNKTLTKPQFKL